MRRLQKSARFCWRLARNVLCAIPGGVGMLFPAQTLASNFGRGDAEYAVSVYLHHARQLRRAGFRGAGPVMEVGPGRNLGSALLWWCRLVAEHSEKPTVILWDVYPNAQPDAPSFWSLLANAILAQIKIDGNSEGDIGASQCDVLAEVASGKRLPDIVYHVCSMDELERRLGSGHMQLLYSQAALEHVWKIAKFWPLAFRLTMPNGWHSHRIDLADHGKRESNYVEMLEWPAWAWWLTMRFVPGAINRWRATDYLATMERLDTILLSADRELRPALPIPRHRLAPRYRKLSESELRTTAIDIVARGDT